MKLIAHATVIVFSSSLLQAQDADLAKKLANPISNLISVPIQSNYDFGIGAGDGTKWTTNIQPVQAFVGARYYAEKPANGPEWGLRMGLTFLFPK